MAVHKDEKTNKGCIIFSGYNPRAVIAFLRTLEKNKVQYAIVASSSEDDIFLTDYSDKVVAIRKQKSLDMSDLRECINRAENKIKAEKYIIAPSTEALNRFLLENRSSFEEKNVKYRSLTMIYMKRYPTKNLLLACANHLEF